MPLHFSGTSIKHRTWENAENGGFRIQYSFSNDCLVLHHAFTKWDVIAFNLSSNLMDDQNRILKAALHQFFSSRCHQQSMSIVNGIAKLEEKYCISSSLHVFSLKFLWSKTILIESIIIANAFQYFNVTTDQPFTAIVDDFSVGMTRIHQSKHTGTALFFVVHVKFWVAKNCNRFSGFITKCKCRASFQFFLLLIRDIQNNRNRLI
mmetsp:Transcript_455/g.821  ORF Transcript_455/g.821 Transcript_455/m.821 type:complete len:206 (-) Transcript_455:507-1124(-)